MADEVAEHYEAVIIGAGPGGLAAAAALLDSGLTQILWVDRRFRGGTLNENYREISSNTKVGLYIQAIRSSSVCSEVIARAAEPNAWTAMERLDHDDTCQLSLAGDLICMMVDGLCELDAIEKCIDEVKRAERSIEDGIWNIAMLHRRVVTRRLILCTGSRPIVLDIHTRYHPDMRVIDLDACMSRSKLASELPEKETSTVAVIGNSHSGVLCCRNLYELAQSGKRSLRIINFHRQPIRFAEYRAEGIVYDNSGLKGATAVWARDVMASLSGTEDGNGMLRQVDLRSTHDKEDGQGEDEDLIYKRELPRCTHIVYAVGYAPAPLPDLYVDRQRVNDSLQFDMITSGFRVADEVVSGLFGCGIAFPEKVADPEGHVEAAVGVTKFFRFAQRVRDVWAG